MENGDHEIIDEVSLFVQLVAMFQIAALQQMGKLPNPITNQIERDLAQAKASIDMLEMLEEKTKGNLSRTESELVDKVLFELRMDYVDEADRAAKEEKEKKEEKTEAEADETGDETDSDAPGDASDDGGAKDG